MERGKLFVISAPSGTGKTTILKGLMANLERIAFSISHTTRQMRAGEQNGVDYHFVSKEDFLQMQEQGSFVESACVHENYYGTSYQAIEGQCAQGIDVVLDIDVQGARILMEKNLDASFVFIAPPSMEILEERLRGRASDTEETIQVRLNNAADEMQAKDEYEYLIVNDDLDQATALLQAIIWAERSKGRRSPQGQAITQ